MKQISTKARISFHRISAAALSPEGFRLALAVLLIAAAAFGGFHMRSIATMIARSSVARAITLFALLTFLLVGLPATALAQSQSSDDFNTLSGASNNNPTGIWSDDTTMWVADSNDDKIYAYNLNTKARDASKDFNTLSGADNDDAEGIWSDGTTMWVADSEDAKLYAYRISTKARDSGKDFNTLSWAGNNFPTGIWSDGTTMWVADGTHAKLYAYRISTKARDASKDFNTLSGATNHEPTGIWSDGTTMWVADDVGDKIYAYQMSDQGHDSGRDFTTLDAAGNNDPRGIWSDSDTMWVADPVDDKVYSYNMPPSSSDATLSALTVGPEDIIGFAPDRTTYEVGVASTETRATITATASDSNASVAYSPADADTSTTIHDVDLSAGRNAVTVTVTSEDGSATETYTVSVNRGVSDDYGWKAVDDLDGLIAAGNTSPFGIWSNGTTMWVADLVDDRLYAYNTDGMRDSSKDFDTLDAAGNEGPTGIWSDGATMWVADIMADKIYAYRMSDKERDIGKDFNTLSAADNNNPRDIWSDGATMWVADRGGDKIYAYRMSDKERDSGRDFNALSGTGNNDPYGIWSDGTTMWVADSADGKLYAYNLNTKAHDSDKEFNTLQGTGNNNPASIWSDGTTMWVADLVDDKVYSYNMLRQQDVTTLVSNLDVDQFGGLPMGGIELKANSFTTAAGHRVIYELSGIRTRAKRLSGSSQTTPLVTVHRDDGGRPAIDSLYTLENPRDILGDADTDYRTYTFSARPGATLDAGQTYWVVFAGSGSEQYGVAATTSSAQTPQGWLIGDVSWFTFAPPDWQSGGRIVQFAVLGKKVSPLEEEPDADLPGGPADCHLTTKVVQSGYPSSGHLTAGVDTDSGLTGDCFRLETQWGKQYRVEVKFGSGESVERGGSVWIVYTGSDFSGMSSLGSAVDHNREDGRSFTDFKHIHNGVKSYFVDVAAYDLYSTPYSTNSLTYHGPYTITMTDITGVQRMVTNLAPGATSGPNENIRLGSGNTEIDLATQFTTGSYPFGYQLDQIRVPFHTIAASGANPLISIHRDSSGDPGAKLCDVDTPAKIVESAVTWSGNPPPFTFLARDCAHITLTASTPYWVAFSDVDYVEYLPEVTDSNTEHAYGSGWIIGNAVEYKRQHLNSWSTFGGLIIRFELWARPKGPPNATGYPLIQGRFAVGQTLTAHPNNIADPDGLNEPEYTYQWVLLIKELVDLGIELEIQGATDRTYTVTGIAAGDRLKVRVSFRDAAGGPETRTSPASSHIAPRTTSLISNLGRNTDASPTNSVGLSTGFIAGAGSLKYRVATAQVDFPATGAPGLTQDAFKFRLSKD